MSNFKCVNGLLNAYWAYWMCIYLKMLDKRLSDNLHLECSNLYFSIRGIWIFQTDSVPTCISDHIYGNKLM